MSDDVRKGPLSPVSAGPQPTPPDRPAVDDEGGSPTLRRVWATGAAWVAAGVLLFLMAPAMIYQSGQGISYFLTYRASLGLGWASIYLAPAAAAVLSGVAFLRAGLRLVRGGRFVKPGRGLAVYSLVLGILLAPFSLLLAVSLVFALSHLLTVGSTVEGALIFLFCVACIPASPALTLAGFLTLGGDARREWVPAAGRDPADLGLAPPYPATVALAAMIWFLYGCFVVVNLLSFCGSALGRLGGDEHFNAAAAFILADGVPHTTGGLWGSTVVSVIRAVSLFVGLWTLRGAARDTIGAAVASLLLAMLLAYAALVVMGIMASGSATIAVLQAGALLTAGVLALAGRKHYLSWRAGRQSRREYEALPSAGYAPTSASAPAPPYPRTVRTAAVLWMIFGCLALLGVALSLPGIVLFGDEESRRGIEVVGREWRMGAAVAVVLLLGLSGAAFLFFGVRGVRGTAGDTLAGAVASLLLAVLLPGSGAAAALFGLPVTMGSGPVVGAASLLAAGLLVLTAGVLALAGRRQYLAWRAGRTPRR